MASVHQQAENPEQAGQGQGSQAENVQIGTAHQSGQGQAEAGGGRAGGQGAGQPGERQSAGTSMSRQGGLGGWPMAPFGMMTRMFEEMERFFDEVGFGRSRMLPRLSRMTEAMGGARGMPALWAPQIEMSERDGQLVVRADLPGLRKEDIKVDLSEGLLTIQGERQEQRENRGYSERTYGSFYRTVPLPEGVEAGSAQAKFQDGVLEITLPMPKREQESRRQIEIR
jgi:HSP20 family protein